MSKVLKNDNVYPLLAEKKSLCTYSLMKRITTIVRDDNCNIRVTDSNFPPRIGHIM
jgi:hypothetical protein